MTNTLGMLRRVLTAEGFRIEDAAPKIPPGGFAAYRGTITVVVQVSDGALVDAEIRQRVRVAAGDQRPRSGEVAATAEVPGLRSLLVMER